MLLLRLILFYLIILSAVKLYIAYYSEWFVSSIIQCFFFLKGTRKTLVLHEIPEDDVRSLLTNRESLANCDVAVFIYDR